MDGGQTPYIYTHIYIYIYHVNTYINIHVSLYIYTSIYTPVDAHIHMCMYTFSFQDFPISHGFLN